MKNKSIILMVIVVVLLLLVGGVISTYNNLQTSYEEIDSAHSNISVQLKRRTDLIPNLIGTVKGYMKHEDEIIDKITQAREKLAGSSSVEDQATANENLNKALNNLYVVVENYPELKSNQNFIQLQDELAGTENRIAVARKDYNDKVKEYNLQIVRFPKNILANMFGFKKVKYFEISEKDSENVEVNFE